MWFEAAPPRPKFARFRLWAAGDEHMNLGMVRLRKLDARRLSLAALVISVMFSAWMLWYHVLFRSYLALAQGVDSLVDVLTASVLYLAVLWSERPADQSHPFGHEAAQPIAALLVSVLAAVLAFELVIAAVRGLLAAVQPELSWALLLPFVSKALAKGILYAACELAL